MKKKVRVYGFGGTPQYKRGGEYKTIEASGPVNQTQDSTDDNIPQQKTGNFLDWLKNSTEASLFKQSIEQQQELIRGIAQDGYSMMTTNIPEHLKWNRNLQPGAVSKLYGKKKDPNASIWAATMEKDTLNWEDPLNTMQSMVTQVFSKPNKWELDLKKGQNQHDLFTGYNEEGYAVPELNDIQVTGVKKNGNKRTLTYNATGTQKYLGNQQPASEKTYYEQPKFKEETPTSQPYTSSDTNPNTVHGQMTYMNNLNQQVNQKNAENYLQFPGFNGNPFSVRKDLLDGSWAEKNPELIKMLGNFAYGGIPKAQYGNFPDLESFITQSQDYNLMNQYPPEGNPSTTHGMMDFLHNMNTEIAQTTGTERPQYEAMGAPTPEPGDRNISENGELKLKKVSNWDQATAQNPYLASQTMIAGMQLLGNIGNLDERAAQEAAIRERVSNVHRLYNAQGSDRGDYMVNVPGVGDFLKPDQHTRMGYNTKVAKMGYQIDDEVDLTEEEIKNLIAQGYNLEFLD